MTEIVAYEMQFLSKTIPKTDIKLEKFREDLIVNKNYQNDGIGRKLLFWAIKHIRNNNDKPIILHVAEWNKNALKLYLDNGFKISKIEKVR